MDKPLNEALDAYQKAFDSVRTAPRENLTRCAFSVLMARDLVELALSRRDGLSLEGLEKLESLDRELLLNMAEWKLLLDAGLLQRLHRYVQPPAENWWWYLSRPSKSLTTLSISLFNLLLVAFVISLVADISRRLVVGSTDTLGVLALGSQTLIALFAASTFTEADNAWLEAVFGRLGIHRPYFPYSKTAVVVLLFVLTVSIRELLPHWAAIYNESGVKLYNSGDIPGAIRRLDHAVTLNPDDVGAHYNLARALTDLPAYDRAAAEYQATLYLDSRFFPAYSGLSYMYLAHKSDSAQALTITEMGLKLNPSDQDVRYALFKNRAWAELGLHCLRQAEGDVARALSYRPDSAAAHCILAQVQEARGRNATGEWKDCLSNANREYIEPAWLAVARERIDSQGTH